MRKLFLLLVVHLAAGTTAAIVPVDCVAYSMPLQLVQHAANGPTMKALDLVGGSYSDLYAIAYDRTTPSFKTGNSINAASINPFDSIAYGVMKMDISNFGLVRFDATAVEIVGKVSHMSYAGSFNLKGSFFYTGGGKLMRVDDVASLPSTPGAQGWDAVPTLNITEVNDGCDGSDLVVFDADLLNSGTTQPWVVSLNNNKVCLRRSDVYGNAATKYTLNNIGDNATGTYGSAWNYQYRDFVAKIFFAANLGSGVFELLEVNITALTVNLKRLGASEAIAGNDGLNCLTVPPPYWAKCSDKNGPLTAPAVNPVVDSDCQPGYLSDPASLHEGCTSDTCNLGSSSTVDHQTCCKKTCDATAPPLNGAAGNCSNATALPHSHACQPVCNQGYYVSGTSRCNNGNLSAATCLGNPCLQGANAIPLHGISSGDCTAQLSHGASCNPACRYGYGLTRSTSCHTGSLTGALCEKLTCDATTPPSNGYVGSCGRVLPGSTCQPACKDDYMVSGASSCALVNGQAVLSAAVCTANSWAAQISGLLQLRFSGSATTGAVDSTVTVFQDSLMPLCATSAREYSRVSANDTDFACEGIHFRFLRVLDGGNRVEVPFAIKLRNLTEVSSTAATLQELAGGLNASVLPPVVPQILTACVRDYRTVACRPLAFPTPQSWDSTLWVAS